MFLSGVCRYETVTTWTLLSLRVTMAFVWKNGTINENCELARKPPSVINGQMNWSFRQKESRQTMNSELGQDIFFCFLLPQRERCVTFVKLLFIYTVNHNLCFLDIEFSKSLYNEMCYSH